MASIENIVSRVALDGYEAFCNFTETVNPQGPPVFFYFSGSKLPSGESWCADCVEAQPVVDAYLAEIKENIIFVNVDVGDRAFWKDKGCPFRTDPRIKLMVIPTIVRWSTVRRLEGSQCNSRDLLEMLFSEGDD